MMKTFILPPRHLWLVLAIQINLIFPAKAQEQKSFQDSLVAPLPSLLVSEEGVTIESSAQWEEIRRPEILELFRDFVYGGVPETDVVISSRVVFEDREALNVTAIQKEVVLELIRDKDTLKISMLLFLPGDQPGPHPIFLGLNFYGNQSIHTDPQISLTASWVSNSEELGINKNRANPTSRGVRSDRWPVEMILSRGYGLATIYYGDIDPDFDEGFKNGVHGLLDPGGPGRDSLSWGSISAWAWGLSRAMDYFGQDAEVDQGRVALMGHSRLGKTALWAGATDERFALVISNNSGCGGAALSRRPCGERVSRINTVFPHWFAARFRDYNDKEEALPVDQHMLLALVAPRPLYVASAWEDDWADQRGEYLSLVYGSEAYRLYDPYLFLSDQMPAMNQPVHSGKLGYHIRSGKHDVTRFDWEQYLAFADKHMKTPEGSAFKNPVTREWLGEHLQDSHPRLILTPALESRIREQLEAGDSLVSMGMELMLRNADSLLDTGPIERQMVGRRMLSASRHAIGRLTTLSLAYRFQRDQRYLKKLEQELQAICSFSDWNPSHFLDVAEMAAGVALAIDWAGEWMSPDINRMARHALITMALEPAMDNTAGNWWITSSNNWNLVCHGGLSLAALVVYEDAPELATAVLHQAVKYIPLALVPYAPDGIYPEGASYWFYATTYLTAAISSYESALA